MLFGSEEYMGQRLVVELYNNEKKVASIYYHWSAYFKSTICELANLSCDILQAEEEHKDPLLGIIEGLEERGGGLRGGCDPNYKDELDAALALFPNHKFSENVSRNNGLISFTEEGMKSFRDWLEGYASIELDSHKIFNGVSCDGEEWLEYDYIPVGQDGEGGYIQSAKAGVVSNGDKTCKVNAFELTCEEIFELAKFIGLEEE